MSATFDYGLLQDAFGRAAMLLPENGARGPRQRLLHQTLRAAIRDGTLAAGTRLVATRTLAQELGIARNSVLYAYEQLASEGYVVSSRGGTVVAAAGAIAAARPSQAAAPVTTLARRALCLPPWPR